MGSGLRKTMFPFSKNKMTWWEKALLPGVHAYFGHQVLIGQQWLTCADWSVSPDWNKVPLLMLGEDIVETYLQDTAEQNSSLPASDKRPAI